MSLVERDVAWSPAGALAPVWPSLWYPLHEGGGPTLAERLFGLAPLNMLGGPLPESDRYGAVRPNWTDAAAQYATTGAADEALAPVLSLQGLQGQQLLLGFELECSADVSAGGLLWWGPSGPEGGGGWGLRLLDEPERPLAMVIRGASGTEAIVHRLREAIPRGPDSRCAFVLQILGIAASQLSLRAYLLPYQPRSSEMRRSTREPVDPAAGGSEPPHGGGECGLTLFAERRALDQVDAPLRNAWLGNLWAQRRAEIDESLGQRCCLDMVMAPREFPISLRVR